MAVVISLRDFVGEMQMLSAEHHAYVNKVTGELVMLSDDDFRMAERDEVDESLEWQDEIIQDAKKVLSSDDYLGIPNKFDIHEYEIMERFCPSIPDLEVSDVLLGKIRGSGAFRRFNGLSYKDDLNESLQDK